MLKPFFSSVKWCLTHWSSFCVCQSESCVFNCSVPHCQDTSAHPGASESGARSAGCNLQGCNKRSSSCYVSEVHSHQYKKSFSLWSWEMVENMIKVVLKPRIHCDKWIPSSLCCSTVRTIPAPLPPAGYMDTCTSTRWQETSTSLLASMYLRGCKT